MFKRRVVLATALGGIGVGGGNFQAHGHPIVGHGAAGGFAEFEQVVVERFGYRGSQAEAGQQRGQEEGGCFHKRFPVGWGMSAIIWEHNAEGYLKILRVCLSSGFQVALRAI